MRIWSEDEGTLVGLSCSERPTCKFGHGDMEILDAKLHKFSINDGDDIPRSHAIDVEFVCPVCGNWRTFGVAISPELYEKKRAEYDGLLAKN